MTVLLRKTRQDLTHQDFKNINELLFQGKGYKPGTLWRMVRGERTTPPVVEEAIDIYLDRIVHTADELSQLSKELMEKHGFTADMVEA